jgi:hypothetical protein
MPILIHLLQLVLLAWLSNQTPVPHSTVPSGRPEPASRLGFNPRPISRARLFLRMAWLANPFAYVAINTVVAVVPGLARELQLTPKLAGFFCSIWFFARMGTFLLLWLWTGWHYRLRWFLGAYLLLIASFATILLVPRLEAVVLAQITFGTALGLVYYSSLFYSMNVGESLGEHGGFHEAAIGAGLFAGPAIGAVTLRLLPQYPGSSAWAVSLALCGGLVGLLYMARPRR